MEDNKKIKGERWVLKMKKSEFNYKDLYIRYSRYIDENTKHEDQEKWVLESNEDNDYYLWLITKCGISFTVDPDGYVVWDDEYLIFDPFKIEIELTLRGY